jgi:hypothetical protein
VVTVVWLSGKFLVKGNDDSSSAREITAPTMMTEAINAINATSHTR